MVGANAKQPFREVLRLNVSKANKDMWRVVNLRQNVLHQAQGELLVEETLEVCKRIH